MRVIEVRDREVAVGVVGLAFVLIEGEGWWRGVFIDLLQLFPNFRKEHRGNRSQNTGNETISCDA
jgi:hypothetical protein